MTFETCFSLPIWVVVPCAAHVESTIESPIGGVIMRETTLNILLQQQQQQQHRFIKPNFMLEWIYLREQIEEATAICGNPSHN